MPNRVGMCGRGVRGERAARRLDARRRHRPTTMNTTSASFMSGTCTQNIWMVSQSSNEPMPPIPMCTRFLTGTAFRTSRHTQFTRTAVLPKPLICAPIATLSEFQDQTGTAQLVCSEPLFETARISRFRCHHAPLNPTPRNLRSTTTSHMQATMNNPAFSRVDRSCPCSRKCSDLQP